ncbi:heterokaryon incompatibility protein-domain-containing protein [Paraphoma chrysanthemicola]|nr:heterokaryon incompatibility protein-domain-containing protein [Paraphoma chrysanthemicola]
MRLLNVSTLLVEEFDQCDVPPYAILSHTWEEEEVSLQDIQSGSAYSKKGYAKIQSCCKQAREDGFTHCWIDTCNIDKTSSAELSEAINSMFKWYKNSTVCYVYMSDYYHVDHSLERCDSSCSDTVKGDDPESLYASGFASARWWTRGWTLQELLAPSVVEFYDKKWTRIGTKTTLCKQISHASGIDEATLCGGNVMELNVAVRMSWAAGRQTARLEDEAYCLMGLFGVNMPPLYGEGRRAFVRLQEEIMRSTEDYTLFLWQLRPGISRCGLLADSPDSFQRVIRARVFTFGSMLGGLEQSTRTYNIPLHWVEKDCFSESSGYFLPNDHSPPSWTSRGVRLNMPLITQPNGSMVVSLAAVTRNTVEMDQKLFICLWIYRSSNHLVMERGEIVVVPKGSTRRSPFQILDLSTRSPVLEAGHLSCPFTLLIIRNSPDSIQYSCSMIENTTGWYQNPSSAIRKSLDRVEDRGFLHLQKFFACLSKDMKRICMEQAPSHCFALENSWSGWYDKFTFTCTQKGRVEKEFDVHVAIQGQDAFCRISREAHEEHGGAGIVVRKLAAHGPSAAGFYGSCDELVLTDGDPGKDIRVKATISTVAPVVLEGHLCNRMVLSLTLTGEKQVGVAPKMTI